MPSRVAGRYQPSRKQFFACSRPLLTTLNMLNWRVFGKISTKFRGFSWIYLNFAALRLCKISEALRGGAVTVVFLFSGSCELKTYCFVLYKVVTANSGEACVVL